jgi:serine/threonine protein kinase
LDSDTLDLLDKLLTLDPDKRITAEKALEHDYFRKEPLPATIEEYIFHIWT